MFKSFRNFFGIFLIFVFCFQSAFANDKALDRYLNSVIIAEPVEYKNMKIFPVLLKEELCTRDYVTLDQAYKCGLINVRELGSGVVNTVEMKNCGKEPIFIMNGEIIRGAKQDRMVKQNILLEPNDEWIRVPVYCVEHGRWHNVSKEFTPTNFIATSCVRKTAATTKNQSEVWDSISLSQDGLGVKSETGTLIKSYENDDVKCECAKYEKCFEFVPHMSNRTVGVIVTSGSHIVCFDLFANNDLFKKYWVKLLKSYILDVISGSKSTILKKDVSLFINGLFDLKRLEVSTPGLGCSYELESDCGCGQALVDGDSIVHMDFFVGKKVVNKPVKYIERPIPEIGILPDLMLDGMKMGRK